MTVLLRTLCLISFSGRITGISPEATSPTAELSTATAGTSPPAAFRFVPCLLLVPAAAAAAAAFGPDASSAVAEQTLGSCDATRLSLLFQLLQPHAQHIFIAAAKRTRCADMRSRLCVPSHAWLLFMARTGTCKYLYDL
jgi:hypothetical protein